MVVSVLIGAGLAVAGAVIWWSVRALRQEEQWFREYRDGTFVTTLHVENGFWHTDDSGTYIELDDGSKFYWGYQGYDPEGVSS